MHLHNKNSLNRIESSWALDKQLEAKDLPAQVVKFCAGFPTYLLKDITKENWQIEQDGREL